MTFFCQKCGASEMYAGCPMNSQLWNNLIMDQAEIRPSNPNSDGPPSGYANDAVKLADALIAVMGDTP